MVKNKVPENFVKKIVFNYFSVFAGLYFVLNNLYAVETSYNFGMGALYTDNSLLTEKNQQDELSINTLAGFNVADVLPNLIYSLNANVIDTKYTNKTLADTTYYNMIANLNWDIIPTTFSWQINDNLSVQDINQSRRPLPNNKQQVNIFNTGPSFVYRISPVNRMLFDYRYFDIKYEQKLFARNTDSKRDVYQVALEHRMSENSNVTLNYLETAVDYLDETFNNDFTGKSTYLLYDTVSARSIFNLAVGFSTAKLVKTGKEFDSNYYNFQWDYQINYSSNFSARYSKGLSDATNDINLSNFLNSGVVNTANLNDTSIYTVERFYLLYTQLKTNWQTSYSLYGIDQDYDGLRPNLETYGGSILVDYNISRSLVLTNAYTRVSRKSLATLNQKTLDNTIAIGTRYYISTFLQFITQYRRNERTSNQAGRSYDENVLFIGLTYNNAPRVVIDAPRFVTRVR